MKTTTPKTPSIHDLDLADKIVVVRGYADPMNLFECHGGFGCEPDAMGQKIMGRFLSDGEACYIRRPEVVRIATPEDLKELEVWRAMEPHMHFRLQIDAYHRQIESLRDRLGGAKSLTKDELKDAVSLLYRRCAYLNALVVKYMDHISRKETEKPE